jgi:hypothetical protein
MTAGGWCRRFLSFDEIGATSSPEQAPAKVRCPPTGARPGRAARTSVSWIENREFAARHASDMFRPKADLRVRK